MCCSFRRSDLAFMVVTASGQPFTALLSWIRKETGRLRVHLSAGSREVSSTTSNRKHMSRILRHVDASWGFYLANKTSLSAHILNFRLIQFRCAGARELLSCLLCETKKSKTVLFFFVLSSTHVSSPGVGHMNIKNVFMSRASPFTLLSLGSLIHAEQDVYPDTP